MARFASLGTTILLLALAVPLSLAQLPLSEQVQVGPPVRRVEPPSPAATAEDLEKTGDNLRADKSFLDALDYYRAALAKKKNNALLLNKIGITELQLLRHGDARKDFERAIKADRSYADAHNNLGVIHYLQKKYGKAIKEYRTAIQLRQDSASFFSNLGTAYFAKKDFENAMSAYGQALALDPEIFDRTSHSGVTAQMSSPGDRARYSYMLAKMYARIGDTERCLQQLRRAMEEGYRGIDDVYKDAEFTTLRKDPRFTALMAAKPTAIPE
jgi:tetratricopeptide (TPR) repeat protein